MALAFNNLTRDEIVKLSGIANPGKELDKMSFDELEIINEQISDILSKKICEPKMYKNLMKLRSYIILVMWSA
jgi:hypothetical protein